MGGNAVFIQLVRLPRAVWLVLTADTLSAVGSGLTLPFLLVYLHRGHSLSLPLASIAVTVLAVAALVGNPVGGAITDRVGPRATLIAGLATAGSGAVLLAQMSAVWHGFAAAALTGAGMAVAMPAQDALLARLVSVSDRPAVFGLRHATLNLGLGCGAMLAALIVDTDRVGSFVTLYLLDASTFFLAIPVLFAVAVPALAKPERALAKPERAAPRTPSGYRTVARDRTFRRLWVLVVVLFTVGYGQFNAALPALATGPAGLDARMLSLVFGANTLTVVAAQVVALRLTALISRAHALTLLCVAWALTWALILVATATTVATAPLFVLAAVVFGLGETLLAPTVPALVNELAPEPLRGRYNGANALACTTGFAAGPLIAGLMLGGGFGVALLLALVISCVGSAVLAKRLSRHISASADRPGSAPEPQPVLEGAPA